MSTPARRVHFGHYLAYGSNDFLGAGAMSIIGFWILFFYTTFCGLSATQATIIFATARLLDAFFSPVIGYISDRFHNTWLGKKFGRRRFFILLAIPLVPSFALMWVDGQSFWYYLITYCFFELVYAMEIIPYETLAAEMSPNYQTKAKFAGARIICGQIANIAAMWLPGVIIAQLGGKESGATFLYLGVIFSVFFVFVALAVYLFTWERPREEIASIAPRDTGGSPFHVITDLFHELWATLRIRAFRLHLGMYIGGYISQDVLNLVLSYIIAFIFLGSVATASSITTWMACAQLVSVGLAIWLTLRIHAAASYRIALGFFSLGILGFATLYFAGVADIGWFLAVAVIAGLGRGALNFIPWSVYNYMPDVDEIVTGRRREGAFAGVMTFIRKLLQSGVAFAVGPILDASGLIRSVKIQPVHVVNTAVTIMLVGSLGLMIFGFLVSLRFRLNRDTHTVLMDEIERFKNQPGTEPTPENRAVVEDLTGWKYEELWGKGKS
ncbi:MAG TPA: MFS transporter [Steroidobacteraceae bacterium]|nr:MFS transporter [Steroidobacteraceae bacterium]